MNADSAAVSRRPGLARCQRNRREGVLLTPACLANGCMQDAPTTRHDSTLSRATRRRPVAPPYGVFIVYAALALSLVILPRLSVPTGASRGVMIVQLPAPVPAPTPNTRPATTPTPMPSLRTVTRPAIQTRSIAAPAPRASDSGIVEATCAGVRLAPRQNYERAPATSCGAQ